MSLPQSKKYDRNIGIFSCKSLENIGFYILFGSKIRHSRSDEITQILFVKKITNSNSSRSKLFDIRDIFIPLQNFLLSDHLLTLDEGKSKILVSDKIMQLNIYFVYEDL